MASVRPTVAVGEWWEYAACQEIDIEIFYPLSGKGYPPAKAICRDCPVIAQCGAYALSVEAGWSLERRHGVWGGMDPLERMARDRQRS